MSEDGVKYYEREDVLFRDAPGKPLENYQNGWSEYSGESFRVRNESAIIDEATANKIIAENDAHWEKISKKQKKAA